MNEKCFCNDKMIKATNLSASTTSRYLIKYICDRKWLGYPWIGEENVVIKSDLDINDPNEVN